MATSITSNPMFKNYIFDTPMLFINERKNKVREYAASHDPKEYKMPNIIIYWKYDNKKGSGYKAYFPFTGELKETPDNHRWFDPSSLGFTYNNCISTSCRKDFHFYMVHYIKDLKAIEFNLFTIKANRGKEGEIRKPSTTFYGDHYNPIFKRVFMFNDSAVIYEANGEIYNPNYNGKYYNTAFVDYLKALGSYEHNYRYNGMTEAMAEFTKQNTIYLNSYNTGASWTTYSFTEFYKKITDRKINHKRSRFEDYNDSIEDNIEYVRETIIKNAVINPEYQKDRPDYYYYNRKYEHNYWIFFELVNDLVKDKTGVFRIFKTEASNDNPCAGLKEIYRIFVNSEVRIYSNIGGWNPTTKKIEDVLPAYYTKNNKFFGIENIEKIPSLKYLKPIIEKFPRSTMDIIVNFIRHPILEKLYKSGFPKLARLIDTESKVAANINSIFGTRERKNMSISEMSGMTNKQLKYVEELLTLHNSNHRDNEEVDDIFPKCVDNGYIAATLTGIKDCCECKNVSDLDLNTFKENYENIHGIIASGNIWRRTWNSTVKSYCYLVDDNGNPYRPWNAQASEFSLYQKLQLIKIYKMLKKENHLEYFRLLGDIVNNYVALRTENRPNINIYGFTSGRELVAIHNQISELSNAQWEAQRAMRELDRAKALEQKEKDMANLTKKRLEKFGYSNETYTIKVPEKLIEISEEGCHLHHCVGGYVESYARGETNILFLRKNDNPDNSFYTIEVDPSMKLVQLHGLFNKWLGNNPEAISFVKKWLEEKGIKYDPHILLCTSEGYNNNRIYLDGTPYGLPKYNK